MHLTFLQLIWTPWFGLHTRLVQVFCLGMWTILLLLSQQDQGYVNATWMPFRRHAI